MKLIIGFDVGTRRIGVAVGNSLIQSAEPVGVVKATQTGPDWLHIDTIIKQWQPDMLVVGLPLTRAGQEQEMSRLARHFGQQAQARYALEVALQDERHTSQEAARRFQKARQQGTRRRHHASELDAMAAVIILENYLHKC